MLSCVVCTQRDMLALRSRLGAGALVARPAVGAGGSSCKRCLLLGHHAAGERGPVNGYLRAAAAGRRDGLGGIGGVRSLSGGFFNELKKSFQKEVEQNKEFRDSLSKLKKDADEMTGNAQESSSKLSEEAMKYATGVSSKLSETTGKISASLSELKSRLTPAAPSPSSKVESGSGTPSPPPPPSSSSRRRATAAREAAAAEASKVSEEAERQPPPPSQQQQAQGGEGAQEGAGASDAKQGATAGQEEHQHKAQEGGEEAKSEKTKEEEEAGAGASVGSKPQQWVSYDSVLGLRVMGKPWRQVLQDGRGELREAWEDLFNLKEQDAAAGMRKQIYKPAAATTSDKQEGEEEGEGKEKVVKGGGALVVVKDQGSTWQRLTEKLRDAPIIQEILKAGSKLADTELGRQAGKLRAGIKDRVEDVREVWETSQNPLVYKLSSMWDDLTSETELGIALREIRRADPEFVLEDWVSGISNNFLPSFFQSYLKGDLKSLQPYLSEGMYRSLAEEFRLRKAEGLVLDPNVLEIGNTEVIQAKMHDHQPVLMVGTLIQHINCVRNREGKVVEGTEDEVRASFYLLLFSREFNEEEGALVWKITERYLGFSEKYI